MSAVNLAEVFGKLAERGLSQREADTIVYRYRLEIVPFDEELARQTGVLRPATSPWGFLWATAPVLRLHSVSVCPFSRPTRIGRGSISASRSSSSGRPARKLASAALDG